MADPGDGEGVRESILLGYSPVVQGNAWRDRIPVCPVEHEIGQTRGLRSARVEFADPPLAAKLSRHRQVIRRRSSVYQPAGYSLKGPHSPRIIGHLVKFSSDLDHGCCVAISPHHCNQRSGLVNPRARQAKGSSSVPFPTRRPQLLRGSGLLPCLMTGLMTGLMSGSAGRSELRVDEKVPRLLGVVVPRAFRER